jgi:hypothetical protein
MLLLAVGVVVLSFALEVRPDQRVALHRLSEYPMPETCRSRALFGVKCPGCGLTRSFIYLAQGDWNASLAVHRLGWLLALAVLLQFPYRLWALRAGDPSAARLNACRWFGYFLIAALVGNWLWDLLSPAASGARNGSSSRTTGTLIQGRPHTEPLMC